MPTKGTTRRSVVTLDVDRIIAPDANNVASTIYVGHIVVANNSGGNVLVEVWTGDGGARETTLACPANDTVSLQEDWLADKGLLVKSVGSANVFITIFHSAPGA